MVGTFGFGSGGGVESGITAHASTHLNGGTDPIGNLPLLNVTQTFSAYQTLSAGLAVQGGTTLTGAFNLVTSGNTASITGNTSIVGGLTVSAGLTLSSGGIGVTGNSSVAGTFSTTGLYTAAGGITVSSGGLTVSSGTVSFNTGATIGTGQVLTVQAGTAAAPSIVPTGNTNTGVWFPATSTIAWSTAGTEKVRIDSSGNVGIGTTSPEDVLHVKGTGQWVQPIIDSSPSTTGGSSVVLRGNQNSWVLSSRSSANGFANNGFSLYESLGNAIRMTVLTGGNVGIGTTSPLEKFSILDGNFVINKTSYGGFLKWTQGTTSPRAGYWEWGDGTGWRMDFGPSATPRLSIYDNGNVGIGTTSPGQLLDVAGTARATNFIPSGLTGATTAVRIVGGTTSAPPASGTFVAGDMVIGTSGAIYICTTGGTPGNWTTVGSGATTTVFNKSFLLMGG